MVYQYNMEIFTLKCRLNGDKTQLFQYEWFGGLFGYIAFYKFCYLYVLFFVLQFSALSYDLVKKVGYNCQWDNS